jgi:hypothetical protein
MRCCSAMDRRPNVLSLLCMPESNAFFARCWARHQPTGIACALPELHCAAQGEYILLWGIVPPLRTLV